MKHRDRVVFRHIDLIEHAEPTVLRRKRDGTAAQPHLAAGEGVGADEHTAVGIHMERGGEHRAREEPCKVVRKDVLARRLSACEQEILPLQQRGDRRIEHLFADKLHHRARNASLRGRIHAPLFFEPLQPERKVFSHDIIFSFCCGPPCAAYLSEKNYSPGGEKSQFLIGNFPSSPLNSVEKHYILTKRVKFYRKSSAGGEK